MNTHDKGQSTIEYILLVTAVVAVMIAFTTGSGSIFQKKLTNAVTQTSDGMVGMADRLMNSAP